MAKRSRDPLPSGTPGRSTPAASGIAFSARLSGVLGEIYELATDAHRLQRVLDGLTGLAGADNGGLSIVNAVTGEAQLFMFSPMGLLGDAEVLGMYRALEPWRRTVVQREPGRMYVDAEISLLHELTRSAEYLRWLQLTGNRSRSSGFLALGGDMIAFIGFARGAHRRPFTRADVQPVEALLPHFARAVRINRTVNELTVMHDVAEERYGTLGVGVVLLSTEYRVVYTSRAAQRILGLGLGLSVHSDRLHCAAPGDQAMLDGLIEAQGRLSGRPGYLGGESMTLAPLPPASAPLSLLVTPYQNRLEVSSLVSTGGRVLVLLFDPSFRTPTREQALQQIYGMSESESVLAAALAGGQRLADIARAHGLSKETLRSRLKRVFTKTGTRRQGELLRLLLASPALLEHRSATRPAPGGTT